MAADLARTAGATVSHIELADFELPIYNADLEAAKRTLWDELTDAEIDAIAAAHGGTTSIVDFAIQYKGQTLREARDAWMKKAEGKAAIDYGFHMIVSDYRAGIERELDAMVAAAFDCAQRLFGLRFVAKPEVAAYHPDVKVYEAVQDELRKIEKENPKIK